ncbi:acyltransferase domain-containing protein [Rhodoferax sp.]|uniref:acyltransferase domain-containing protein n=1 Tax=Rhodoferax sp. TaxID=50421 RepID=UPI00374D857B
MGFALIFSGQGMQHPAMLPWLATDALVRLTCERLGVGDWRQQLADPAWAANNRNAQCLLTGLGLAAWQQLANDLPVPAAIAGYSVGELAAFSAAGVFTAETALDLANDRAEAMDRCAAETPGGLLAVSGLSMEVLDALCQDTGLAVAIRNGVDSAVLGGPLAALARAERAALQLHAHCTPLKVSVASHTPWMRAAAEHFAQTLAPLPLQRPRSVLFSNAADRVLDAAQAKTALATQIAQTVRWDECMDNLHARGVHCVLEVGPGQALARIWNQRYPEVPARACDDFRSAAGITSWIHSHY